MTSWQNFPERLECLPGIVYLIGTTFNASISTDKFYRLLSKKERLQALKFKFSIHQQRYILFHAVLRMILSTALKIEPQKIEFGYGFNLKPFLINTPFLQFNLSHTENEAMVALTLNTPIGVDIEMNKNEFPSYLAERFFSTLEVDYLYSLPEPSQAESFYQIWTHKEAFIKATGLGLAQDLQSFSIGLNPSTLIEAANTDVTSWSLQALQWKKGFSGAIATKQKILAMQLFKFSY